MDLIPDSLKLENLRVWDHGLVAQSLSQSSIFPRALSPQEKDDAMGQIVPATAPKSQLSHGTFSGTAKALTEVFRAGESRYVYLQTRLKPSPNKLLSDFDHFLTSLESNLPYPRKTRVSSTKRVFTNGNQRMAPMRTNILLI
jgi:hypothetical protein